MPSRTRNVAGLFNALNNSDGMRIADIAAALGLKLSQHTKRIIVRLVDRKVLNVAKVTLNGYPRYWYVYRMNTKMTASAFEEAFDKASREAYNTRRSGSKDKVAESVNKIRVLVKERETSVSASRLDMAMETPVGLLVENLHEQIERKYENVELLKRRDRLYGEFRIYVSKIADLVKAAFEEADRVEIEEHLQNALLAYESLHHGPPIHLPEQSESYATAPAGG